MNEPGGSELLMEPLTWRNRELGWAGTDKSGLMEQGPRKTKVGCLTLMGGCAWESPQDRGQLHCCYCGVLGPRT